MENVLEMRKIKEKPLNHIVVILYGVSVHVHMTAIEKIFSIQVLKA